MDVVLEKNANRHLLFVDEALDKAATENRSRDRTSSVFSPNCCFRSHESGLLDSQEAAEGRHEVRERNNYPWRR